MTQIFISYSRPEQPIAARLAELLTAEGYEVWWDASLSSGARFEDEINIALRNAPAAIILWSKTAVESEWVRAEADVARRKRSAMPAVIDDVAMDRLPLLFQQLHVSNLRGWTGDESAKGYRELLGEVARRLKQPPKNEVRLAAGVADTRPVVLKPPQPLWRRPFAVAAGGLFLGVVAIALALALRQPQLVAPLADQSVALSETQIAPSSETSILTTSLPPSIVLKCKSGETRVQLGPPSMPFLALCVGRQWKLKELGYYGKATEFDNFYTGTPLYLEASPVAVIAPWESETGTRLVAQGSQTINGRLWSRKEYALAEDTFTPELRYVYEHSAPNMVIRLTMMGGSQIDEQVDAQLATGILFSAVFRDGTK